VIVAHNVKYGVANQLFMTYAHVIVCPSHRA
jgi:hypothetical protein